MLQSTILRWIVDPKREESASLSPPPPKWGGADAGVDCVRARRRSWWRGRRDGGTEGRRESRVGVDDTRDALEALAGDAGKLHVDVAARLQRGSVSRKY